MILSPIIISTYLIDNANRIFKLCSHPFTGNKQRFTLSVFLQGARVHVVLRGTRLYCERTNKCVCLKLIGTYIYLILYCWPCISGFCASSPCKNGGLCIPAQESCQCLGGTYSGRTCEIRQTGGENMLLLKSISIFLLNYHL